MYVAYNKWFIEQMRALKGVKGIWFGRFIEKKNRLHVYLPVSFKRHEESLTIYSRFLVNIRISWMGKIEEFQVAHSNTAP